MLNNISFQANFIKPVIIQKKDTKDNWHPFKVSMVELDKTSVEDRKVLYEISKSWGTYNYVSDIYNEVLDEFLSEKIDPTKHVFAITTQKADYDNLRTDDVMCIAKFNEGKKLNELEYIQVNPEHGYVNYDSNYKKIGTTMIKFLSEAFNNKPISVFSASGTVCEFYKKNDFKPVSEKEESNYFWKA